MFVRSAGLKKTALRSIPRMPMSLQMGCRYPGIGCFRVAQFDVHRLGDGFVVDCQADLLNHLKSRFVVPLLPEEQGPKPARRLNPVFEIGGANYVMATQFASAVHENELSEVVATLGARNTEISGAIDVLIAGV